MNTTEEKNIELIGELIDPEEAGSMIHRWQVAYPTEAVSATIGIKMLQKMIDQPGTVGIKFFNGHTVNNVHTLIYVAVDANDDFVPGDGLAFDQYGTFVGFVPNVGDRSVPGWPRINPPPAPLNWTTIFDKKAALKAWNKED